MKDDFKNMLKIIDMEDELNEITEEIDNLSQKIKNLIKNKKNKIKLNYSLTITEILIALIGSFNLISIPVTLFYMLTVCILIKLIDIKTFDTFDNINKEKRKLSIQKEILLAEYNDIEKNLFKLKLINDVKKENNAVVIDNNYNIENTLVKNNIKKLTLKKPNN